MGKQWSLLPEVYLMGNDSLVGKEQRVQDCFAKSEMILKKRACKLFLQKEIIHFSYHFS